jgi:hypothetical protein
MAADTTDLQAFDVPLKLIAAQDIGGRNRELFSGIIVDEHESADLVVKLFTDVLKDIPGAQVITDQGTPYMAQQTIEALEALEADHAPQREGEPLGKATIERAFGTVKRIAAPILSLTNRLAQAFPSFKDGALAKATVKLLLVALLKAYQAGARLAQSAAEKRQNIDEKTLHLVAEQSRNKARAENKSARLLLSHLHGCYGFEGSVNAFIRRFRHFPLEVLIEAERTYAPHAHRDDIRQRTAYFGAIVRRMADEHRQQCAHKERGRQALQRYQQYEKKYRAQLDAWAKDPCLQLIQALEALTAQVNVSTGELLFGGEGLGKLWLQQAMDRCAEAYGAAATLDMVSSIFISFERQYVEQIGKGAVRAIEVMINNKLADIIKRGTKDNLASLFDRAKLENTG